MAGGPARWESERQALGRAASSEQRAEWHESQARRMDAAYEEAVCLLARPENAWAAEAVRLYLDAKDHGRGLSPADMTPWGAACFSAIRAGSGGLLGNPPLL